MDSIFGLARSYQLAIADTYRGASFIKRQLHIKNVVAVVRNSTAALPRHAYGEVDPATLKLSFLCVCSGLYTLTYIASLVGIC